MFQDVANALLLLRQCKSTARSLHSCIALPPPTCWIVCFVEKKRHLSTSRYYCDGSTDCFSSELLTIHGPKLLL